MIAVALRRTLTILAVAGITTGVWSCSESSPRDVNYGTDAGAGFEAPVEEEDAGADAQDAGLDIIEDANQVDADQNGGSQDNV